MFELEWSNWEKDGDNITCHAKQGKYVAVIVNRADDDNRLHWHVGNMEMLTTLAHDSTPYLTRARYVCAVIIEALLRNEGVLE